MKRAIAALLLFAAAAAASPEDWKTRIRRDHPRLFFNRDTWPAVKARALGAESKRFAEMRSRVDALHASALESRDYGTQSAEAAFVFLVSGEERYRALAVRLLTGSVDYYRRCTREKTAVDWYTFSRINAIAAFDWLFEALSPAERKHLGGELLQAVEEVQPTKTRAAFTHPNGGRQRENWGGTNSGFYSTPSLLWFAGLATHGEGIDDPLAERFLTRGFDLQTEVLAHRANIVGDDGGSAAGTLGYLLGAYPWAEYNFFHTFRSATGADVAADWPYLTLWPSYLFWNWLPGGREFGYGDARHSTNEIRHSALQLHLLQLIYFYGHREPGMAGIASWLAAQLPEHRTNDFPWACFLLTALPEAAAADPIAKMPIARHFEKMGQIFFRSGSGPDDTYALFTAGATSAQHKHFDNNNFVIYRSGFLALDSGTRPEPGQHLSHYYARTVAHNAILIRMPGEEMPSYWGANPGRGEEKLPFPNDGGQRNATGSQVSAFEASQHFAYAAGDATASYHPAKCRFALRQFVFVPPAHIVVFDRVESTNADYPKTWLLHTAEEPAVDGALFTAKHEQGRLFSRTLLPENARLQKIGGPGRQFWSGGRNWALPAGYVDPDTTPLFGQWRVEVTPAAPRTGDLFLHLIETAPAGRKQMSRATLVRKDGRVGARFQTEGGECELLFSATGPAAGTIRLTRGGRVVAGRELRRDVQPQKGLYGSEN